MRDILNKVNENISDSNLILIDLKRIIKKLSKIIMMVNIVNIATIIVLILIIIR